jgi:L-lactate dehydrogenase complex protein LldG
MTTKARSAILQRLRSKQPVANIPTEIAAPELPRWPIEERIGKFRSMLESARAEVHIATTDNWADTLKCVAREKQINNLLYARNGPLAPAIESAWGDSRTPELICDERPVDEWKEQIFYHIDAALTCARAAIAETGSLVLWPDAFEPRTWSLVPPLHFVIVDVTKLYNTFAEVIETEQWAGQMPTNALLISGPSKSADIQQTLAYGVHGPIDLVVILRLQTP